MILLVAVRNCSLELFIAPGLLELLACSQCAQSVAPDLSFVDAFGSGRAAVVDLADGDGVALVAEAKARC